MKGNICILCRRIFDPEFSHGFPCRCRGKSFFEEMQENAVAAAWGGCFRSARAVLHPALPQLSAVLPTHAFSHQHTDDSHLFREV